MKNILFQLQGCLLTEKEILQHCPPSNYSEEQIMSQVSKSCQILPAISQEKNQFICQRCHNQKDFFVDNYNHLFYCLNCIQLGRLSLEDHLYYFPSLTNIHEADTGQLSWPGKLSPQQAQIADQLCKQIHHVDKADLVHAVTGSGKTEMIFPVISQVIRGHGRVVVASPRIDVCLELYPRLQAAFPNLKVKLFYGKSKEKISYSPLTISTTHQLLRFQSAFDLLIVDEVDSFPYVNDPSLHWAVKRALKPKGKLIFLTATPDASLERSVQKQEVYSFVLPARYHRHPLPEPEFVWIGDWRQAILQQNLNSKLYQSLTQFASLAGSKLIFMPNIALAEKLHGWLCQQWSYSIACVHAQDPLRQEKVLSLRNQEIEILITTTILERGVTFSHCHVYVVGAEHSLFNKSSLVQISGRVGRKADFPKGTLIYGHFGKSSAMVKARREIKHMNDLARKRGLIDD